MFICINNQANNYKIKHIIPVQTHQISKKRKKNLTKLSVGKEIVQRWL